MTIETTSETRTETAIYLELTCGKKSAFLGYSLQTGFITVCVQNAAHRVWRGMGRTFVSFADALAAYKSAEVKAMIEHLSDELTPALCIVG